MAIRDDFTAGEVLAAADLNDTFASKPPFAYGTATPTTTVEGFIWYDENEDPPAAKFWDGTEFQPFSSGVGNADFSDAATGTYTDSGIDYKYVTYNSSGTLTCTVAGYMDALIVAGGGGGGGGQAGQGCGSGGAGGMLFKTQILVDEGEWTITIGAGGAGGLSGVNNGTNGTTSRVVSYSTVGGGFGATNGGGNGGSGGSGGGSQSGTGGAAITITGNALVAASGNAGGNPISGGGGGAGGAGSAGAGGVGLANSITGASVTYAAGGTSTSGTPVAGTANTGNGGQGKIQAGNGSAGGSGVVIIRVRTN